VLSLLSVAIVDAPTWPSASVSANVPTPGAGTCRDGLRERFRFLARSILRTRILKEGESSRRNKADQVDALISFPQSSTSRRAYRSWFLLVFDSSSSTSCRKTFNKIVVSQPTQLPRESVVLSREGEKRKERTKKLSHESSGIFRSFFERSRTSMVGFR